ncbi:MBL fold metallo-hydrolase [Acetobacter thailandicus]|uniref:MBL fold metallo-hydrolase n=1 Tax=Acetobacter thailandicus TaxID=1502842 RepID=UPI001BA74C69|nr:MBL fold metallo-hydrolase [Acetobacter thailandicus]MBS1004138.1 MBL fold metallo-hydrolase [Acetobacter thailandicus]
MDQLDAPQEGVLEISVFGKGYGESIVIHLPDGKWIIIDTYLDINSTPIALKYLRDIGINPASSVSVVLLTHWHDDHIQGASTVVSECSAARIALTGYLQSKEFNTLMSSYNNIDCGEFGTGVDELEKVLHILNESKREHFWCYSNTLIFSDHLHFNYQFEALSPSSRDFENLLLRLQEKNPDIRMPSISPNNASVAAVLRVNKELFLFGADLENGNNFSGWGNICTHVWNERGQASFFKIAHHGSSGAAHPQVWENLLQENAQAVLTPWNRGKKLPTIDGVKRINQKTLHAYAAAKPTTSRAKTGVATIDKIIKEGGIKLLKNSTRGGQVRFRKPENGQWQVTLFGDACHLKDVMT